MTDSNIKEINYFPSETFKKLRVTKEGSKLGVKAVMGCIGSGKSAGMVMEVGMFAPMQQLPYKGVRKVRVGIIRNTYDELKRTTIKTFQTWIPETICPIKMTSPPEGKLVIKDIGDGTSLEVEFFFLALDRPEDQRKLRSFEVTFIWINEAQYIDEEIVEVALDRCGRYPPAQTDTQGNTIPGTGATNYGVFLDFNPPDTDHFLYKAFEVEKRPNWVLLKQPPAIIEEDAPTPDNKEAKKWVANPLAENIRNLPGGYDYYLSRVSGMKRSRILVDYCGKWGASSVGMPVYSGSYDDDVHVSAAPLKINTSLPLYIGVDFGLHPAIVFGQISHTGQLLVLAELDPDQPTGISFQEFLSDYYRPTLLNTFPGARTIIGYGDPAGRGRNPIDKVSAFGYLKSVGVDCKPTVTNEYIPRKEAVEAFLNRRNGFLLDPKCVRLRKGFLGGYGYKRTTTGYKPEPDKNSYSHPHDALQYLCLGILKGAAGERAQVTNWKTGQAW